MAVAAVDYTGINPATLSDGQLTAAIADLAARAPVAPILNGKLVSFRIEKLNRTYRTSLATRQTADPLLANTTTVSVSA